MSDIAPAITSPTPEETEASLQLLEHTTEPKRKTNHGLRVPPERKATIYALFDAGKLSQRAIAERLGMNWNTVAAVLAHRDTDAALARNVLGSNSLELARNWLTAAKIGAKKGRHQPAMDALERLGIVAAPERAQANINVAIVLGQPIEELPRVVNATNGASVNSVHSTAIQAKAKG